MGEILGAHFSSPPPVDVGVFLEAPVQPKSSSRAPAPARPPAPLLLVTSPGVDALEEVLLLAAQGPEGALANVSLGQGQVDPRILMCYICIYLSLYLSI